MRKFASVLSCMMLMLSAPGIADGEYHDSKYPRDFFSLDNVLSRKAHVSADFVGHGTQPALDSNAYKPYEMKGDGQVTGYIEVKTTRGKLKCDVFDSPYLVPATSYLSWLAQRVVYLAETTGNPNAQLLFIDSLPQWMRPGEDDEDGQGFGVVRRGACIPATGFYWFNEVPYGRYFLMETINVDQTTVHTLESITVTDEYDWDGDITPEMHHHFTDYRLSQRADAFMLLQDGSFTVSRDEPNRRFLPDDLAVAAHLHAWLNYKHVPPISIGP